MNFMKKNKEKHNCEQFLNAYNTELIEMNGILWKK